MKLEEAIAEVSLYLNHSDQWTHERLDQALLLLIEAGNLVESMRVGVPRHIIRLLPGETKE